MRRDASGVNAEPDVRYRRRRKIPSGVCFCVDSCVGGDLDIAYRVKVRARIMGVIGRYIDVSETLVLIDGDFAKSIRKDIPTRSARHAVATKVLMDEHDL